MKGAAAVDRNFGRVLVGGAGVLLIAAVLLPIGMTLFGAVWSDSPGMASGHFTMTNIEQVYGTARLAGPLLSTAITCGPGTLIALVFGVFLAWLMQRTDVLGQTWLEPYLLAPIYFSPLALALGWVLLGAPRIGLLNVLWPGPGSIVNVYSHTAIALFIGCYFTPYVYLIIAGSLRSLDAGYEDAGAVLGARPLRTFLTITLPMLRPQLLASSLLVFVISASMFAEPLLFGLRFRFENLPIVIFGSIANTPSDYNFASAVGTFMLIIACIGLAIYRRALVNAERFVTTQSRGFFIRRVELGAFRPVAVAFIWIYLGGAVVLPTFALLFTSLMRFIGPVLRLDMLTFSHYVDAFNNPTIINAILNTLIISASVATACTVIGLLCAYYIVRKELPGGWLIDVVSILPIGVPAIVLSVGFLWAYLWLPLGVYGTIWALIFALTTVVIPNTIRNLDAALRQLGNEVEFAARLLGAGTARRIVQIVLPMLAAPLISGWLFAFMLTAIQVSVPIMLRSPGQEMLSVTVWALAMESGRLGEASVAALLQGVLAALVVVLASRVSKRASAYAT
jgi:iron(III) transport system permease protein